MFFTNSSCTWQIGAPSEWTDNSILKIKINRVVNSTCHINQGGTMLTARNQTECKEGDIFEYKYQEFPEDNKVFIVGLAKYIAPPPEKKSE